MSMSTADARIALKRDTKKKNIYIEGKHGRSLFARFFSRACFLFLFFWRPLAQEISASGLWPSLLSGSGLVFIQLF
jgi:hypothetical protein